MTCPQCGAQAMPGVKFCSTCGTGLNPLPPPPPPNYQPGGYAVGAPPPQPPQPPQPPHQIETQPPPPQPL